MPRTHSLCVRVLLAAQGAAVRVWYLRVLPEVELRVEQEALHVSVHHLAPLYAALHLFVHVYVQLRLAHRGPSSLVANNSPQVTMTRHEVRHFLEFRVFAECSTSLASLQGLICERNRQVIPNTRLPRRRTLRWRHRSGRSRSRCRRRWPRDPLRWSRHENLFEGHQTLLSRGQSACGARHLG